MRGLSLALCEQEFVQAARALGVRPPTPTWGRMLAEGRDYLTVAGRISIFPYFFGMQTAVVECQVPPSRSQPALVAKGSDTGTPPHPASIINALRTSNVLFIPCLIAIGRPPGPCKLVM